jgi:glucose/arabinose dehydrogenase
MLKRKWLLSVLACLCMATIGFPFVSAKPVISVINPPNIKFQPVFQANSFQQPIAVRHVADGTKSLYVVEKIGRIYRLLPSANGFRKQLFLDISDRVQSAGSEQGLLGLVFHPNYKENGLLYVNYISKKNQTIISSFVATVGLNGSANKQKERILLTIKQPYANHNGGDLAFGRDGYLYIATGDGGSQGDPQGYSQNLKSLLGKILRIDVRPITVNGKLQPYRIPTDNPFVKRTGGVRGEIFAYGLRNPWRMSFDRLTGLLWAADVGQNAREEINIIRSGANYGWNVMEGTNCYRPAIAGQLCNPERFVKPIFEYQHQLGKSVTGGYVYRGNDIPAMRGKYIFADFVTGRMWTLESEASKGYRATSLKQNTPYITSFGEDERGELYFVTWNGALYRMVQDQKK